MGRIRELIFGTVAALAISSAAHGATGDIVSSSIDSSGLFATITLDNLTTGGTYDFANKAPVFTVVSEGYTGSSLGTVTRAVRGVSKKSEATASGDLVVEVWLDAPVFADDEYRMGATDVSGTDPTVAVLANWVTGATADTDTVSNNSQLPYPKAIAHWISVPCQRFVGTWTEQVAAFGNQTDENYPLGISRVVVRVTDSASDYAEVNIDAPTLAPRLGTLGPADEYALWQAEFNADIRTGSTPFAKGNAKREFWAYPRIGDETSVFHSDAATDLGHGWPLVESKANQLYLDPNDDVGTELGNGSNGTTSWVDSGYTANGAYASMAPRPFEHAEWVIGSGGGIASVVSTASGQIKLASPNLASFYKMQLDFTVSGTPQYGDIIRSEYTDSNDNSRFAQGFVLSFNSGTNEVIYRKITSENFTNVTSTPVQSLYKFDIFRETSTSSTSFIIVGSGEIDTLPTTSGLTGDFTTESTSFTSFKAPVTTFELTSSPAAVGVDNTDTGRGQESMPYKTIYYALLQAQAARATAGTNEIDGCTIKLKDGDYILGDRSYCCNLTSNRFWTNIVGATTDRNKVRIVGTNEAGPAWGISLNRAKFSNLTVYSMTQAATVSSDNGAMTPPSPGTPQPQNLDVVWIDDCNLCGAAQCQPGAFLGGGGYGHQIFTRCTFHHIANPLEGRNTVRDCDLYRIGGDVAKSGTRVALNLDIHDVGEAGNTLAHPDIAQMDTGTGAVIENVIWYHVRVKQAVGGMTPGPNINGHGAFRNGAFINMVQNDTNSDPFALLGQPDMSNILLWNFTLDHILAVQCDEGELVNLSVRSAFIKRVQFPDGATFSFHPANSWNVHYREVESGNEDQAWGTVGGNYKRTFITRDPGSADYYRPVNNADSVLRDRFDVDEVPVGVDVNADAYLTGDIGAVRSLSSGTCGTKDFNGDGDDGTDQDIEAFFACVGGTCCPECGSADFNGDGDLGTDADIEAFFRVLGGGNC